jgi:hypothetical protein
LGPAWDAAAEAGPDDAAAQVPYVVGVLCAKFGEFGVSRHLRRDGVCLDRLDSPLLVDLLVMAMHEGAIDWMRERLPADGPGIRMRTIVDECRAIVERYDEAHPRPPGVDEPRGPASVDDGEPGACAHPLPEPPVSVRAPDERAPGTATVGDRADASPVPDEPAAVPKDEGRPTAGATGATG